MNVPTIELFSGTESISRHFREAGDPVVSVELDPRFRATITADVRDVSPIQLLEALAERPTFVWASPPCTAFSVGSFRHHFSAEGPCQVCGLKVERVTGERWAHSEGDESHPPRVKKGTLAFLPKSDTGRLGVGLLESTLLLVRNLAPRFWVVENPRAMMRNVFPEVAARVGLEGWERRTITHCLYGDPRRMKPTDLWGVFPEGFQARACTNGSPCHEAAPRGAKTGTQGLGSEEAAMLPPMLGAELREAIVGELEADERVAEFQRSR